MRLNSKKVKGWFYVKYRIEYADGRKCSFTTGRDATIHLLKNMDRGTVSDVRRVYKNGISETVLESYGRFLKNA